jgi:acyl carrier protein
LQDILERVRQATVAVLKISAEEISLESRFRADLGADSINLVEIAMALEAEFDILLEDDEVANIVTVQDAVTYIAGHQK